MLSSCLIHALKTQLYIITSCCECEYTLHVMVNRRRYSFDGLGTEISENRKVDYELFKLFTI